MPNDKPDFYRIDAALATLTEEIEAMRAAGWLPRHEVDRLIEGWKKDARAWREAWEASQREVFELRRRLPPHTVIQQHAL